MGARPDLVPGSPLRRLWFDAAQVEDSAVIWRILCRLGFHDWREFGPPWDRGVPGWRGCGRCDYSERRVRRARMSLGVVVYEDRWVEDD